MQFELQIKDIDKPKDVLQSLRVIKGPDTDDGRISCLIQKSFNGGISDDCDTFIKKMERTFLA